MKKPLFKKILNIIDYIETKQIQKETACHMIVQDLEKDHILISYEETAEILDYLYSMHMIKDTKRGIDLTPSATVFAKSDYFSSIEALGFMECIIKNRDYVRIICDLIEDNKFQEHYEFYDIFQEKNYSILKQTIFFEENEDHLFRINRKLLEDMVSILREYEHEEPLISNTLCALYTSSIVSHEDLSIEYRNMDRDMIPYPFSDIILHIIPRKGIPCDRNETKALQTFYKDTLFHEFNHCCPICGIDLPHMLIASHIKPFRDCAHIYEAVDHNNGLLLCRNHDYLFDQGYISFQQDGRIMISKELSSRSEMFSSYALSADCKLPDGLLTAARLMFLHYHRDYIFKK